MYVLGSRAIYGFKTDSDDMKRVGLVEFDRPDSLTSAMLLCGTCHASMGTDHPYFIILPTDLDWFIDHER